MGPEILNVTTDATTPPQFDRAYPWVVKSLRQSQLLEAWLWQVRAANALPSLQGFTALQAYREQSEVTIYEVVRENGSARYMVVQEGAVFRAFFGISSAGRFLDEAMSQQALDIGRVSLDACVRRALPVYTVFSLRDKDGRSNMCERLLLPFGTGSSDVTTLATSFKITSWDQNGGVLATQPEGHRVDYSFRAVIALE